MKRTDLVRELEKIRMRIHSSWGETRLVSEPEDEGISAYSSSQGDQRAAGETYYQNVEG
jgi:hypothetical protein